MARYIRNIVLNKPADFVAFMMNDYLQKNGFSFFAWKYDAAFRNGQPIPQPIPIQTVDNSSAAVMALVFGI